MKTLCLIRHAKAEYPNHNESDFLRSLHPKGREEAREMAEKLINRNFSPDFFISSTALRAKQTTEIFSSIYGLPLSKVFFNDALFNAYVSSLQSVISKIENQYDNIILVGHNPGITEFINQTFNQIVIDNMPTCGIFCFRMKIDSWEHYDSSEKEFLFFDRPSL